MSLVIADFFFISYGVNETHAAVLITSYDCMNVCTIWILVYIITGICIVRLYDSDDSETPFTLRSGNGQEREKEEEERE